MNKRFHLSSKLFLSACVAVLAVLVLLAPIAQATPYLVKLTQQGNKVVASGSGELDLTGLDGTIGYAGATTGSAIEPNQGLLVTGPAASLYSVYTGFSGPSSFGGGSFALGTAGTGYTVDFDAVAGNQSLAMSQGYISGTALTSGTTWNDASFSTLGLTPGKYEWKWGAGTGEQTFTLLIGNAVSAPEPAVLGMFGCGLLLIGAFVELRRRVA